MRDNVSQPTCEEVTGMGLKKHGTGEVVHTDAEHAKIASKGWTEEDAKALREENRKADETEESK